MNEKIKNKIHNERIRILEQKISNQNRNREFHRKISERKIQREHRRLLNECLCRYEFIKKFYKPIKYTNDPKEIAINGEFGIESSQGTSEYIRVVEEINNTRASEITFNFTNTKRIYPSAVTLLCSFQQMITAKTQKNKGRPRIFSLGGNAGVSLYLRESGFNDYVRIANSPKASSQNIVKIKHEYNKKVSEARENEILSLIEQYSSFDQNQMRLFKSTVFLEALINVFEHGIPFSDAGWWTMAEYIPSLEIISVCIADNGIGIRNSLTTGPQREYLAGMIDNSPKNEGEFIKKAFELKISGATTATVKKRKNHWIVRQKKDISGAQRGNGLGWVKRSCCKLGVSVAIFSNTGYYRLDGNDGSEIKQGYDFPVFSGTMYHFAIPARKHEND